MMANIGVIFDMDGVLAYNNEYHLIAWRQFCQKYKLQTTDQELVSHFGMNNRDYFDFLFHQKFAEEQVRQMGDEKEELYRIAYKPHLKQPDGLLNLLKDIKSHHIKIGLASAAPIKNVDFILDGLNIREYFDSLLYEGKVVHLKPHPEIYLKSANALGLIASKCVVFEDSDNGIKSALSAGCKVIAVASYQPRDHYLGMKVICNFNEVCYADLLKLIE